MLTTSNDAQLMCFEEAFNILCGELIGEGISRKVFRCRTNPDFVVKVESDEYSRFANVSEFQFWQDNAYNARVSDWLAPCKLISPNGRVLVQEYCRPANDSEIPDTLPRFITDLKLSNFGVTKQGKFVCVDYASRIDNPDIRMRKVEFDR